MKRETRIVPFKAAMRWTGWDPRTMVYLKGGAAWARNEFMFSSALSIKTSPSGWTIGGGVEWAMAFARLGRSSPKRRRLQHPLYGRC
jgi:hypothetical protein